MVRNRKYALLMLAILILQLAALFSSNYVSKVEATGNWLSGWMYRKAININGVSGAGYGYQMMVKVHYSSGTDSGMNVYLNGKCQSDFDDVRFADVNGNVFPYAITYQTSDEAWFWFKPTTVDLSSSATVYIYYGNSEASSESNVDSTFVFADPFNSATLDTNRWQLYGNGSTSINTSENYLNFSLNAEPDYFSYLKSKNTLTFPSVWLFDSFYAEQRVPSTPPVLFGYRSYVLSSGHWASWNVGIYTSEPTSSDWGMAYCRGYNYYQGAIGNYWYFREGVGHNDDKSYDEGSAGLRQYYIMIQKKSDGNIYINATAGGKLEHTESNTEVPSIFAVAIRTSYYNTWLKLHAFKIRKFVSPEPNIVSYGSEETAPNPKVRVNASPSLAGSVSFKFDGITYSTPQEFEVGVGTSHTLQALSSTIIINASYQLGFSFWEKDGSWYSNDLTISTGTLTSDANFTMVYEAICFNVTSTFDGAAVSITGSTIYAPSLVWRGKGYTTFQILTLTSPYNETFEWVYFATYVNGSLYSTSTSFSIYATGNTDVYVRYELAFNPPEQTQPIIPIITSEITWYVRNDLHEVENQLGYRLSETNSYTTEDHMMDVEGNLSVQVGFRAWVYSRWGRQEITPSVVGICDIESSGEFNTTWSYAGFNHEIVEAVEIRIYVRFGSGSWVEMLVAITDDELEISLPAYTWEIYYNVEYFSNETYTSLTLLWGSEDYPTRFVVGVGTVSPWDLALIRMIDGDYVGWILTPFTFHIGDLFYGLVVLFLCVTAYNDTGSVGYVIAILWLFAGVGGILAAMLPAITLNIAYILVAFATALTLTKLLLK